MSGGNSQSQYCNQSWARQRAQCLSSLPYHQTTACIPGMDKLSSLMSQGAGSAFGVHEALPDGSGGQVTQG